MKKVLLLAAMVVSVGAQAQVKSINDVLALTSKKYPEVEANMKRAKYWKVADQGDLKERMPIHYVTWVPEKIDNSNLSDMYRFYYQKPEMPVDKVEYQTNSKAFYDAALKDLVKLGYKMDKQEKQKDDIFNYYITANSVVVVRQAHLSPNSPVVYNFGASQRRGGPGGGPAPKPAPKDAPKKK